MGEIIVHFNKKWAGNVIRMDYKWEDNGREFLIEDIPCKQLPFGTDDYLEEHINFAVDIIKLWQKRGEIKESVSFLEAEKLEGFLEALKSFLDEAPTKDNE